MVRRGPERYLEIISTFLNWLGMISSRLGTGRSLGWAKIVHLSWRPLPDDLLARST